MAKSKNGKPNTSKKGPRKSTGSTSSQQPQAPQKQSQAHQKPPEQKKKIVPKGRSVICRVNGFEYRMSYKMVKEIKRLQKSTTLCIPKLPFSRVVREIVQEHDQQSNLRFQPEALEALHEATEMFMVGIMEDSNICAVHAKRATVRPNDMNLVVRLRRL